MADKKIEPKQVLEREYIVPLRKGWLKVPEYKRASKAIKTLKKFIARHMKLYDDDLRKIKINQLLNNELRFRGMKKPPAKIKIKAVKFDNNIIRVELVNIPQHIRFKQLKELKQKQEIKEKVKQKQESKKPVEEKQKSEEEDSKTQEKEAKKEIPETSKSLIEKQEIRTQKHTSKEKNVKIHTKKLSR